MLGSTFYASSHQNLFTEFSFSGSPEWFKATLIDFYINQFIIWLASCYFVRGNFKRFIWLIVFTTLGSMGTCAFLLIRLFQNKSLVKRDHKEIM
jgi:Na+/H+ antiporter NhaB